MKGLDRLVWNGFLGINTKTDPYDIKDTGAVEVSNLKLSRKIGALRLCPGLKAATLGGTEFSDSGLGGRIINQLGELLTGHQDADSPYYICQAGTDNKFYVWDEDIATWIEVTGYTTTVDTDVVNFINRPNALLACCGSGSANYPVLFSFSGEQFRYGYSGGDKTITKIDASLTANKAQLLTLDDLSVTAAIALDYNAAWISTAPGLPENLSVAYRVALQFDGFQWGPPSDIVYALGTGDTNGKAAISLYLSFTGTTFPRRITGIKIYRRVNYKGNPLVDKFYLFKEIGVNDDLKWPGYFGSLNEETEVTTAFDPIRVPTPYTDGAAGKYLKAAYDGAGLFTMDATDMRFGSAMCANMLLGVKTSAFDEEDLATAGASFFNYIMRIVATDYSLGSSHINVVSTDDGDCAAGTYYVVPLSGWYYYDGKYYYAIYDSHEDLSAMPEMYEDLGFVADEVADVNYELAVVLNKRQYVARLWDGFETNKTTVRASNISGDGTYDYDVYHAEDVITTNEYGISEILGLSVWRNDLIIFGREDILIASPNTGNIFGWSVYDTIQRVGLTAWRSIVRALGETYYVGPNGPHVFREATSQQLAEITDPDNWPMPVTDITECIGILDNSRDEVLLIFPTDKVIFCYDLLIHQWTKYELPITPNVALRTNSDQLLLSDGTDMWELDWDTHKFGTGNIVPEYRSKEIKFQDMLIMPYSFEIRYTSDTDFQLNVYLDGALWVTRTCASGTDIESFQKLPAAKPCNRTQYAITMSSTQAASNTSFEIRTFTLNYKPVERV